CDWLSFPPAQHPDLSPAAVQVLEIIRERGASFHAEIVKAAGISKDEVEAALWELVTAGCVTADGFDGLRAILEHRNKSGSLGRSGAGRWSLLRREEAQDPEKKISAACSMLLNRYGVVFRDLVQKETLLPRWRELLVMFRKMEDRGEVRGGRFVAGFVGEQFA